MQVYIPNAEDNAEHAKRTCSPQVGQVARVITVYLDTTFFVWLASATDNTASAVLRDLNRLSVRAVFSFEHLAELLREQPTESDRRLVRRVGQLAAGTYFTDESLSWDVLRSVGEERTDLVKRIRKTNRQGALAAAYSALAIKRVNGSVRQNVMYHTKRLVPALDIISAATQLDGKVAGQAFFAMMQPQLAAFGVELAAPTDWSREAVLEWRRSLERAVRGTLGDERVDAALPNSDLANAVLATDNRVVPACLGDEAQADRIAHSIRDVAHMARFARHRSEIDFLQLDGPQWRLLQRMGDRHPLHRLGLTARCFFASQLDEVAGKIADLAHGGGR